MIRDPEFQRKLLVLSHSYIRHADDYAGLFVHTLNKALLALGYRISVIAPHAEGLRVRENMDSVLVNRFRYMFPSLETIAYQGTMHDMVRGSVRNTIIFILFIKMYLCKTIWSVLIDRPHLIHAHWWFPGGLVAFLVSILFRIPYVITIHGTDAHIAGFNSCMEWLFRIVARRSVAVVVGSDYLKTVIEGYLPSGDPGRSRIRKIAVPVEIAPTPLSENVREEKNSILTVARLTEQKNLKVLIDALGILARKNFEFYARIIGDGPLKDELEKKILDEGLSDRVAILPSVERASIFDHYQRCSVFILPSVREGLGLVLVEALLMKKPVIASNEGGATEIIENDVSGLLFDPNLPGQLADAILRLLQDPELSGRLAEQGYQSALRGFSPGKVGEAYDHIYQKAFASFG